MITVNGTAISDEAIAREAQYHPAGSLDEALREAAVALVVRALLLQEAAALGVGESLGGAGPAGDEESLAPEERTITALLDCEITLPAADEEALRRYYESNRERFRSPDLFEASHILFAAPPGRSEARAQALAAATATLETLRRDPASFERLAKERSADTESREQGGHLGQITRGQTTPEFEACLDSLSAGELCREPVATRYGYHLIRLDRAIRGRELTFTMARDQVAEYLGARAWTQAVHQYIELLVGKAEIEGIEMAGATSPLVQ